MVYWLFSEIDGRHLESSIVKFMFHHKHRITEKELPCFLIFSISFSLRQIITRFVVKCSTTHQVLFCIPTNWWQQKQKCSCKWWDPISCQSSGLSYSECYFKWWNRIGSITWLSNSPDLTKFDFSRGNIGKTLCAMKIWDMEHLQESLQL
jgi:hypothetical protein